MCNSHKNVLYPNINLGVDSTKDTNNWKCFNWKSYIQLGKEKFTREILFYCKSKAELSYVEAREQFARKVLESDDYYNGHIRVRVHGKGIIKKWYP